MMHTLKLAVSILESNVLIMFINDVLCKVKHMLYLIANYIQTVQFECIPYYNNQDSSVVFLEYVSNRVGI